MGGRDCCTVKVLAPCWSGLVEINKQTTHIDFCHGLASPIQYLCHSRCHTIFRQTPRGPPYILFDSSKHRRPRKVTSRYTARKPQIGIGNWNTTPRTTLRVTGCPCLQMALNPLIGDCSVSQTSTAPSQCQ